MMPKAFTVVELTAPFEVKKMILGVIGYAKFKKSIATRQNMLKCTCLLPETSAFLAPCATGWLQQDPRATDILSVLLEEFLIGDSSPK